MQLTELKKMPVEQLIELGEECGIENASRAKRQDIVFGILKNKAKNGEDIEGEGVLEILQDGFGFLRSPGDCRGDVEINSLGGCFLPRKRFVLVLLELVASGRQPAWRVVLFCAGVGGLTLA